jgi:hypothetical protein
MASVPHFGPRPAPRQAFQEYKVSVEQTLLWEQATPRTLVEDLPVFDRGKDQAAWGGRVATATFARAASDRRPGTPLPPEATGDPHPDRLARAEAIRKQIEAHDNRYRIEGSTDEQRAVGLRPEGRGRGKGSSTFSSTPDIPEPRSYYIDVLPEDAAVEARRGDQVLLFATLSDAARCMTGERSPKWAKAIQNAAGGVTRGAFGWEWARLRSRQKAKWKS